MVHVPAGLTYIQPKTMYAVVSGVKKTCGNLKHEIVKKRKVKTALK